MRLLRTSTSIATLAAAAVLGGCGSSKSSTVTPSAYVRSICNAVVPFEQDVITRSGKLDLTKIKNPAQGKDALKTFLTSISADTDQAVTKLNSAGVPDVKDGKQISTAIVSAFNQLKTTMHRAATQAAALPTTSTQAFQSGAASLGSDVRNSMTSIGQNLQASTVKSPELQKAASKEPACKSLSGA
jgi:hypothetical protein